MRNKVRELEEVLFFIGKLIDPKYTESTDILWMVSSYVLAAEKAMKYQKQHMRRKTRKARGLKN